MLRKLRFNIVNLSYKERIVVVVCVCWLILVASLGAPVNVTMIFGVLPIGMIGGYRWRKPIKGKKIERIIVLACIGWLFFSFMAIEPWQNHRIMGAWAYGNRWASYLKIGVLPAAGVLGIMWIRRSKKDSN